MPTVQPTVAPSPKPTQAEVPAPVAPVVPAGTVPPAPALAPGGCVEPFGQCGGKFCVLCCVPIHVCYVIVVPWGCDFC
jgi:hypothetical protein